jgi:RimJ/RimL family protein N-acetyltransferase
MTSWIPYPVVLEGEAVELHCLEEKHFEELIALANDKRIWAHYPFDGTNPDRFHTLLKGLITAREAGHRFPFVIVYKPTGKLIGSTSFLEIVPEHKKMEIGFTWLHPDHWATVVNPECKLLLLGFAFETLKAVRVQLRTDENNIRSRKAIQKIGATFEGILRNDMLRDDLTHRHSAYFSIIVNEWEEKKEKLTALYQLKLDEFPGK